MKIKFLGTSHGVPMPGRHYQSILIETEKGSYLVDAGAPVMDILINDHYELDKIKAVFVTHAHADHMMGLLDMVTLTSWHYKNLSYDVYLPEQRAIDGVRDFSSVMLFGEVTDRVRYHLIEEGTFFDDGNLKITAVHTAHMESCSNIAYGFLLEAEGQKVYVTGDLNASLKDFPTELLMKPTDLVVTECAHFPAEKLIEKLEDVNAKTIAVVHVFAVNKYDILAEYAKKSGKNLCFPNDGDMIEL